MPENLFLFENEQLKFKDDLRLKVKALAAQNLFLGTSSWKYPGWLGQIYSPERYYSKGRFSKRQFEQTCLAEYAEVFPVVCGDFAFYQFPSRDFWSKLFATAPEQLRFTFKIPEEITARYHARTAVSNNPNFLNADLLETEFLRLLSPFANRIAALIFEFNASTGGAFPPEEFTDHLAAFASMLPQTFRYAIEVRTPELLQPAYFDLLARYRLAHVFNSWTHMPPIEEQMQLPGAFPTDFTLSRALLRPGRKYGDAVRQFAPYTKTQDRNQEVRDALLNLLLRAKSRAEPTYMFINNRLEGNAPNTIYALADEFSID